MIMKRGVTASVLLSVILLTNLLQCVRCASAIRNDDNSSKYVVVFDAGSTGSRVHVFNFDDSFNLLPFGQEYEYYLPTKPGLSSYESDPEAAALSLKTLLEKAEEAIPKQMHSKTPVRLGATAGLRLLSGNASEEILEAVRNFFKKESSLNYKPEWVSILKGSEEGSYQWMMINYLLGRLGKTYESTVGVVDLGGGSVQIAYAVSEEAAAKAPKQLPPDGEDPYISDKLVLSTKYHLYVHSFLNYGLMAARAQSLKLSGAPGNPCITNGFKGNYTYSGVEYQVYAPHSGTNLRKCRALTRKFLGLDTPCSHQDCSFNGVWNGGGGDGLKNLYVASYFYDTASEASIIKPSASSAVLRPVVYLNAAKLACKANVDNIKSVFPLIDERDVAYLCMDLVYEYTLLVDGFGLAPKQSITVLKEVKYKNAMIEAAWPLGCGLELVSSLESKAVLPRRLGFTDIR